MSIYVTFLAALKISGDSIRITGLISETALWKFNVTTNTNNWTVFMKNPKENEMNWNPTKYQVSVEQIAPLLYDLKIKIHFINWEDMGYYQFHIKLDGTSIFLLYLTLKGKFEKIGYTSKVKYFLLLCPF